MKIVAIGGGEIGRVKTYPDGRQERKPIETMEIDREIIRLSGKTNPNLLFIGTASGESLDYLTAVSDHFAGRLGCVITELKLLSDNPGTTKIAELINNADIIYVGGGDTKLMIDTWKKYGVDKLLQSAGQRGVVLSGISAGANCWFEWYDNDEYIGEPQDWSKLDVLPGLGFIKGFCVPHYNVKSDSEKKLFDNLLAKKGLFGYALDNGAALVFDNGKTSIISSMPGAGVHNINMPKQNTKERE
jgi:dipeptidase E